MIKSLFCVIFCGFFTVITSAQLSVTNVMEGQFGKLPNETADAFPSIYDRAIVSYRYKKLKGFVTLEQYTSKYNDRNYVDLSQVGLSFKNKSWDIQLGNFYETLGRGLLLRSFQIPGAIIEDIGFRSRNYFHRDVFGGTVTYRSKGYSLQVLHANVLNNLVPPTADERRNDLVSAFRGEVQFLKSQKAAATIMRLKSDTDNKAKHFGSLNLGGDFIGNTNYYIEYAQQLEDRNRLALYTGINGNIKRLSYNVEFKYYNDFVLGSGINEPPALIRQHTYRQLNRSTHVTSPLNEKGYQVDVYYQWDNNDRIAFNHALAVNKFGGQQDTFEEYFVEWSSNFNKSIAYKAFLDLSQDPFKNEFNRWSTGLYTDFFLGEHRSIKTEVEFQTFRRNGHSVINQAYGLGTQINQQLYTGILYEWTNDSFLIFNESTARHYLGAQFNYTPNSRQKIQLFVGQRRGGPQCSAGVCYEILDFKGVELRWTSQW